MSILTQTRTPGKAFRCTVYDEAGVLAKVDGQILFCRDSDSALIDFEPEMAPWTCILAEASLAATQAILDQMHGGAAWIATHRGQEVQ